jgi:aspartyl protease family protein
LPQRGPAEPPLFGRQPRPPRAGLRFIVLAGIVVAGIILVMNAFPEALGDKTEGPRFVQLGIILTVCLGSLAASRQRLTTMAGQLLAWVALGFIIVAIYGYRDELADVGRRVMAELRPTHGEETQGGEMIFTRAADRQFWIDAQVDGVAIRFMVDTGASSVVLNLADAARLGFPRSSLKFTQEFWTANGRTRGAPVTLREVRIGSIRFSNVEASVNQGELSESLLGMHLLEKLSSVEMRGDRLIIRR